MLKGCVPISLAIVGMTMAAPLVSAQGDEPWIKDYAKARKLARERGKPIFLVFRCER